MHVPLRAQATPKEAISLPLGETLPSSDDFSACEAAIVGGRLKGETLLGSGAGVTARGTGHSSATTSSSSSDEEESETMRLNMNAVSGGASGCCRVMGACEWSGADRVCSRLDREALVECVRFWPWEI